MPPTCSYDATALAANPFMQVRYLIGDTNTLEQQMWDEEIIFALTQFGGTRRTAAECANALSAKYAREADLVGGGLQSRDSQISLAYDKLSKRLHASADGLVAPWCGSISVADKASNFGADIVQPAFFTNMLRNPGV